MRFDLGFLLSLHTRVERGADLDLQVFDHVHHFLALLSDEVGGLGLQASDFSLGVGERLVCSGGNGNGEVIESVQLVVGEGFQTGGEPVGPVVDGFDKFFASLLEPRESLLSLLFNAVEDLFENFLDFFRPFSLSLLNQSFTGVFSGCRDLSKGCKVQLIHDST